MIHYNISISNNLRKRIDKNILEKDIGLLIEKTSDAALNNVKEFGLGVGSVTEPFGGAPHWQGEITVQGHYRGYLSDSHYKKHETPYNAQIISSAEFVEGVIRGYSTNWHGVRFGANNYHKRAVDKLLESNLYGNNIQENWAKIRNRGL